MNSRIPLKRRNSPVFPARGKVSILGAVLLSTSAISAPAAEPPPTRSVAVKVADRLGRPVSGVSACLLPACGTVAWRAEKDGYAAQVPAGEAPVSLRLSARSFEPAEVSVRPEATAVEARLKAKGSVRIAFVSSDERGAERLAVSLKETIDPSAGTRGRLLGEKSVDLEPRPATNAVVFDDVPPGDWVLSWEGPTLAAGTRVVKVAETRAEAGSIALLRGRSVSGGVRDDLGMVVAGARVRLRAGDPVGGRPGGTNRTARTGSDGSFVVHGLPLDEALSWEAGGDEHETARGRLGGETRLEIVLTRAQRVFGRLVDEEALPVAGAAIGVSYVTEKRATDSAGHEQRHTMVEGHPGSVVTREDGTFSFFRRLPASVRIAPEGTGALLETRMLDPLAEGAERGELDLGDLVLRAGRTLTGHVALSDGGAPVAGAELEAAWRGEEAGSSGSARGVSGADGSFRIEAILPGRDLTLTARKVGFSPRTLAVAPEADSVDVLLSRGGRVRGRVCGTSWELANAAVWYGPNGSISNTSQAAIDAAGHFEVDNAETGVLTFARSWRFRNPAQPGSTWEWSGAVRESVEVKEGETAEVSLGCDGIPLSGLLLRDGRPVASEVVSFSLGGAARQTDALTDAFGRFSARVPSPGLWLLSAGGSPLAESVSCQVPAGGLDGCRVELVKDGE